MKSVGWLMMGLLSVMILGGCRTAPAAVPPLDETANLLGNPTFAQLSDSPWSFSGEVAHRTSMAPTTLVGQPLALVIEIEPGPDARPYDLCLFQRLGMPLAQGETVRFSFQARSPTGGALTPVLELAHEPWTKLTEEAVALTPEWRMFVIEATCPRDYAAGEFEAGFHLAFAKQTVELTQVRLARVSPAAP